jgi:hypothetical protein
MSKSRPKSGPVRLRSVTALKERARDAALAQFSDGPNPDPKIRSVEGVTTLFHALYVAEHDPSEADVRRAIRVLGLKQAWSIWWGYFLAEVLITDLRRAA